MQRRHGEGERLRIGVSACLAGASVRFDGGHCHDDVVDALGRFAELVKVCPEVEAGFRTPRESMRLVRRDDGKLSLVAPKSGRDLTEVMQRYAERKAREIRDWDLDGFIVKRNSPSCGMERVRIYRDEGPTTRDGVGLFTAELMRQNPLLVVEEEGRLRDEGLRENFLVRLTIGRRLRRLCQRPFKRGELVAFHTSIKLELLAHSPSAYQALGRLVAQAKAVDHDELAQRYAEGVMAALQKVPSRGRHANVLEHMAGYLSTTMSADDRRELTQLIRDYQAGREPRASALAMLRHHVRRHSIGYLAAQSYLDPTPRHALPQGA